MSGASDVDSMSIEVMSIWALFMVVMHVIGMFSRFNAKWGESRCGKIWACLVEW